MNRNSFATGAALALCALPLAATALRADPVADFYKGKFITMYIGYAAGGGYDVYARLVGQHMGKFIPGAPRIVPKNTPGAGGRIAAAYMYKIAPKDGTALATSDQSLALQQAFGDKGIKFDTTKFIYIGNPNAGNNVVTMWHTAGINSVEDAAKKVTVMGATGRNTSAYYPLVMNALLGTKFRVLTGYRGGSHINLAMEKGEVDGRGSNNWASWKSTRPDWIAQKKINIIAQVGPKREADLPNVPLLTDLAKNDEDRKVMELLSAPVAIGRPIFTTPDVPADRVKAMREAFEKTMKDPAFLADAKKINLEIDPVSGETMQKIVAGIVATPKDIVKKLEKIIDAEVDKRPQDKK
ncbi:MAG: Bug family tripartite tricarboxylate transporter substrate binding protein [Beijerinckiaceae bacterium]